jgi:hypothetical protein
MEKNIDFINKEAFITDLALIKSCLRLLNASISYSKSYGENFSASDNEELHMLVSKIDRNLSKIKENISWEKQTSENRVQTKLNGQEYIGDLNDE